LETEILTPWDHEEWDRYVAGHPGATMYHTSAWCRVVSETGRYAVRCLVTRSAGGISGLVPALEIRSRLTGNRLVCLPFSDVCYPLVDDESAADAIVRGIVDLREKRGLAFAELRGAPAVRSGSFDAVAAADRMGFQSHHHFFGYVLPLDRDTEKVWKTFSRTAVRTTINKSARLGVTVRQGQGPDDVEEFFRLYVLNRRRHGIPPQPIRFFSLIMERLRDEPRAMLYFAEFEGKTVASIMVIRYQGTVYAKYEGADEAYRHVVPEHALVWKSIQDACISGDRRYDFGRTAADNVGLNEFKSRWGTERMDLPYLFCPPSEGLSVVKSASLKYRLFTTAFRRMPVRLSVRMGARIFRHFG